MFYGHVVSARHSVTDGHVWTLVKQGSSGMGANAVVERRHFLVFST